MYNRSVAEKAISQKPIIKTLCTQVKEWALHPRRLFGSPVRIMWLLYAATYTAANTSDTLLRRFGGVIPVEPVKLAATLMVNVPLGIWKDVRYSQIFGRGVSATTPASRLPPQRAGPPRAAMAAFLLRDSLTIFGGFCLPGMLTTVLAGHQSYVASPGAQAAITQLLAPPLVQIVATPIHLYGINLCAGGQGQGSTLTMRSIAPAIFARCLRVIPAYGVGCLANVELRQRLHPVPSNFGQQLETAELL